MTSTEMETPDCHPSSFLCTAQLEPGCLKSAKLGSLLDSLILDLQIYAVTPIPESQEVLQREGVPDNIKSFYKVNHIWKFRYDRPFHKGTKDKENEFKVLCCTYCIHLDHAFWGARPLVNIYSEWYLVTEPEGS